MRSFFCDMHLARITIQVTLPNHPNKIIDRCASDDEEGEGEEKDTDEGEGEAPASRRRGVQQGHQDKGAKRRRRELLEAVLAVGPPVRGARAAAAEEEAGGGSKVRESTCVKGRVDGGRICPRRQTH